MAGTVNPSEIPEVVAYTTAKTALDEFISKHKKIFEEYAVLADAVNSARSQADKEVRSRDVSCGPWDRYQEQTKYDAEALYGALGRDAFLEVGGKLNTLTTYDLDKTKVQAAIARGEISKEIADIVVTKTPKYHAPKDVEIP